MECIQAEEVKPMSSNQRYRIANREKINEQRKKYYQARKESDPKFLEYKRMKSSMESIPESVEAKLEEKSPEITVVEPTEKKSKKRKSKKSKM